MDQYEKEFSTYFKSNVNEYHSESIIKFFNKDSLNEDNSSNNYFSFDEIKEKIPNFHDEKKFRC